MRYWNISILPKNLGQLCKQMLATSFPTRSADRRSQRSQLFEPLLCEALPSAFQLFYEFNILPMSMLFGFPFDKPTRFPDFCHSSTNCWRRSESMLGSNWLIGTRYVSLKQTLSNSSEPSRSVEPIIRSSSLGICNWYSESATRNIFCRGPAKGYAILACSSELKQN